MNTNFRLVLFMCSLSLFFASGAVSAEEPAEEPAESIIDERKQTLEYGIISQILSVLEAVTEEKNQAYREDVQKLLETITDESVLTAVFSYFTAIEDTGAAEHAENILADFDMYPEKVSAEALRYVAAVNMDSLMPYVLDIISESPSSRIAVQAVKTAGTLGKDNKNNTDTVERLLELYQEPSVPEEVKQQIILVLGELKADSAVDLLIEIAENPNESLTWRRFAADSLGKIGSEKGIETLTSLYSEENPYLRANAVYSLGLIGGPDAESVLLSALRDDFWRVRASAAEALGESGMRKASDILRYKARKDPETKVRISALQALGKIGGDNYEFIREAAQDPLLPLALRTAALEIIINDDLAGSLSAVERLLTEEMTKSSSVILEPLCRILASAEGNGLKNIYSKMLKGPSIPIQIYALRGIQNNLLSSLKSEVEQLTRKGIPNSVRKYALGVLESF